MGKAYVLTRDQGRILKIEREWIAGSRELNGTRRFSLIVLFFGWVTAASANVIIPAFGTPYFSMLFYASAWSTVLISETLVYQFFNRTSPIWKGVLFVLSANIISWFAGLSISGMLPDGMYIDEMGFPQRGPEFRQYVMLGFLLAYVLSVVIEGAVLKMLAWKFTIKAPFKMALLANTLSYVLLVAVLTLF